MVNGGGGVAAAAVAAMRVRRIQDPQRAQQTFVAGRDGEVVELDRVVENVDGFGCGPGMGEVNDDFPPRQQRTGPARDNVQSAQVGDRQGPAHLNAGGQQMVIDVDVDFEPVLDDCTVHGHHTRTGCGGRSG